MKKLILALMLSILVVGFGTAYAATSSIDNVPGGAAIGYFQVGSGWETLVNIQNVVMNNDISGCSAAMLVHFVFYDQDSNEIVDFNVPLSQIDNWGARVYLSGNTLFVEPQNCPATLPNSGGADAGCATQGAAVSPVDGLVVGYFTAAITSLDITGQRCQGVVSDMTNVFELGLEGNGNGNPWDDQNFHYNDIVLPNWIFVRTALINPNTGIAFALNATHIQGFLNINRIQENSSVDFVNTLATPDVACAANTIDWNNDGDFNDIFTGMDDGNGIRIDTWELYATLNLDTDPAAGTDVSGMIITDNCTLDPATGGRHRIVGSANGWYWARFNATPDLSDTSLLMIFPANTGTGNVGGESRFISGSLIYNDNEISSTESLNPREVAWCPYLTASNGDTLRCASPADSISHNVFTTGEHNIYVRAPMIGFVYTWVENGTNDYADLYPMINECKAVVVTNLQPERSLVRDVMVDQDASLAIRIQQGASDVAHIGAWH